MERRDPVWLTVFEAFMIMGVVMIMGGLLFHTLGEMKRLEGSVAGQSPVATASASVPCK